MSPCRCIRLTAVRSAALCGRGNALSLFKGGLSTSYSVRGFRAILVEQRIPLGTPEVDVVVLVRISLDLL